MPPQNYSTYGTSQHNPGLSGMTVKYRLDNTELLRDIEHYLRAARIVGKEDPVKGYYEETVVVGRPLANEEGVQGIMGYLRIMISPHNVQGNLSWDRYDQFIYEIHVDLATNMMSNRRNWGISIEDYSLIVDNIMQTLQLFISRVVENKERDSYGESVRSDERTVMKGNDNKAWWKVW